MQFEISLPEDIRSYSEDRFILGTDDSDDMDLDIDDIVAKDFDDVVRDARRYHGKDFFDPARFRRMRPSDAEPGMTFADFDGGTLLLDADGNPVGGYIETDLVLNFDWRGRGLGTELVVEHFLSNGGFPTWWLDSAQYSEAGYSTHLSAHAFPSRHPVVYARKLARHLILDNEEALARALDTMGSAQVETHLTEIMKSNIGSKADSAVADWILAFAQDPTPA